MHLAVPVPSFSRRPHPDRYSAHTPARPWPAKSADSFFSARTRSASNPPIAPADNAALLPIFRSPYRYSIYRYLPQTRVIDRRIDDDLANVRPYLEQAQTITLGDLHGSFLKLVETLVAANLIWMPEDEAKAFVSQANLLEMELEDMAQWERLSDNHRKRLLRLERALQENISSIQWIGGTRQVILLGDIFNDRGLLDTVMSALLGRLCQQAPGNIVWVASNHDYKIHLNRFKPLEQHRSGYVAKELHPAIYQRQVYPYLIHAKLMHYNPQTKTLYTHSPITIARIKALIQEMTDYQHRTQQHFIDPNFQYEDIPQKMSLSEFIDQANRFYRQYVTETRKWTFRARNNHPSVYHCLSKRSELSNANELAFKDKGVEIFVHGHDSQSELKSPYSVDFPGGSFPVDYKVINLNQYVRFWMPLAQRIPGQAPWGWGANKLYLEP